MKKIMLVIVMCLMLVGCGKQDYGVFTKEGYDLLTETARSEIEKTYDITKNFVDNVNNTKYEDAYLTEFPARYDLTVGEIKMQECFLTIFTSIYDESISDEVAFNNVASSLTELKNYISEEYVNELNFNKENYINMRKYAKDLNQF